MFTSTTVTSDLVLHTQTSCCWWSVHGLTTKNQVPRHIGTLLLEQLLEAWPQPVHHEVEHKQTRRGQRVSQWWLKVERNVFRCALPGCFSFLSENYTFSDSKSDLFSDQSDLMYGTEFVCPFESKLSLQPHEPVLFHTSKPIIPHRRAGFGLIWVERSSFTFHFWCYYLHQKEV